MLGHMNLLRFIIITLLTLIGRHNIKNQVKNGIENVLAVFYILTVN